MKRTATIVSLAAFATMIAPAAATAAPSSTPTPTPAPTPTSATTPAPTSSPRPASSTSRTSSASATAAAAGTSAESTAATAFSAYASQLNLGAPTSGLIGVAGGYLQSYGAVDVYYSPATGTHGVSGAIKAQLANGVDGIASIGLPVSEQSAGGNGSIVQRFQMGQIVSSASTGTTTVRGAIHATYSNLGATTGVMGLPTTNEHYSASGARANDFQNGVIVWSPGTGAQPVANGNYGVYASLGWDAGPLGLPTSGEYQTGTGARANSFRNGIIMWSSATGSQPVYNGNYARYAALGHDSGPLGLPTSGEHTSASGARANDFQNGVILWSNATGSHSVYNGIYGKYAAMGWDRSPLGMPTSDEHSSASGARANDFQNGVILWSHATGSHAVMNGIYGKYAAQGWDAGALGMPTTDEYGGARGSVVQEFQRGLIVWSPWTGTHTVKGAMLYEYANRGYMGGSLGAPLTDEYTVPGGWEQQFQGGKLTYVNGSFTTPSQAQRDAIVNFARSQVGKAYATGGTGPNAYDCSGFTQAAYRAAGINIGRTTWDQLGSGRVISYGNAQPGDIIGFFGGGHVGIYIGGGMVIHAGTYSTGVEYLSASLMPYYSSVSYL